jgi:hypothetical protein
MVTGTAPKESYGAGRCSFLKTSGRKMQCKTDSIKRIFQE